MEIKAKRDVRIGLAHFDGEAGWHPHFPLTRVVLQLFIIDL